MQEREGIRSEQIRDQALQSILDTLGEKQKQVYEVISKWQPITNERIALHLKIYPHQVTPRVYELRELGLVEFCGDETSQISKRKASLWRINPAGKQLSLF